MTLIERVARAIIAWQEGLHPARAERMARAAIAAMREPTEPVLHAGWVCADAEWIGGGRELPKEEIARLWDGMIAGALSEEPQPSQPEAKRT